MALTRHCVAFSPSDLERRLWMSFVEEVIRVVEVDVAFLRILEAHELLELLARLDPFYLERELSAQEQGLRTRALLEAERRCALEQAA